MKGNRKMMQLKIAQLDRNGLQTRCALDERTVSEYAEAMQDGADFPPVVVFKDGAKRKFYLADGFHRVEAAMRTGAKDIQADVRGGCFADALRFALGCNARHGKRVTNEDKQNALRMAWDNRQVLWGADPSAALLAKTCGVAERTAQGFIAENLPPPPMPKPAPKRPTRGKQPPQIAEVEKPTRAVVGTDGKVRQMPVRPVAPAAPAIPARPTKGDAPKAPVRPQKPKHVVPVDRYGTEIPVAMNEAFEDGTLADIATLISKARVALRHGLEDRHPAFAAVRQDALVNLNNAYSFISAAEPHCVCRMCQGAGCKACHNRGWQTEEEYDRNPKEFKAKGGAA